MIKNLIIALLFAPHPKKHNLGNHIIMKYEDTSEGPPGITDKRYNFGKNKWMNDRLFELQSARISIIDKEEIAKDVLDLFNETHRCICEITTFDKPTEESMEALMKCINS